VQQLKNWNKPRSAQNMSVLTETEILGQTETPLETDDTQTMSIDDARVG